VSHGPTDWRPIHGRKQRRSRRHRAAALAAFVLASTSSASAIAGAPSLDGGERTASPVPPIVHAAFTPPQHVFPMRAQPEFGDGLDAGRGHEGQDLFAPAGTTLVAVTDAVVVESGSDGGRGNFISIYDDSVDRTYSYFHMLSSALASAGDRVEAGQKVGEVGCTGSCWGDHLHFEVRSGKDPWGPVIDPVPVLNRLRAG
jgi:murein DD-endopeptidase MepM/ murein hydrolase activator NlpD